jgi:hypothetical protein
MYKEKLKSLGARELKEPSTEKFDLAKLEVELGITISGEYASLLEAYNGSIVFDNGAIFRPKQKSPVDSDDGYQSLEMLYGLQGDSNLLKRNQMYRDQIPSGFVTIGESVGGNQICLSSNNGKVYFWFHEAKTEEESLFEIADSIEIFLKSLKKDDGLTQATREIDQSGSFLDF